jgi:hypothetical protein
MKTLELTEQEVEFILNVLAKTQSWETVNDLIIKISDQAKRVIEETAKPKK